MQVLEGGTVVDGTGAPARRADVVIEAGRIVDIVAPMAASGLPAEHLDVSGLVVAPGFVDPHTHYDAQVTWDRDLFPSAWHGVTTVVMGNCGVGIAPCQPTARTDIVRTLENVEGMAAEVLTAGIDWGFGTFASYLDLLAAKPTRLNVAAMVGHTPLRVFAMGGDTSRPATGDEVRVMRAELEAAMERGALGLSTTRSPTHVGDEGVPIQSRWADLDELEQLGDVLRGAGVGVVEAALGPDFDYVAAAGLAARMARPVTFTYTTVRERPGAHRPILDAVVDGPGRLVPQFPCRPVVLQIRLSEPFVFGHLPVFGEALAARPNDRAEVYKRSAWRTRAVAEVAADAKWAPRWAKLAVSESGAHGEAVGVPLSELADRRGVHPFEVMLDFALDDDLTTRFRLVATNDDEDAIAELLADDRALLGLSDAGAHADQICDADWSTHLLAGWVRERKALSLERAVWRLTGQPAELFGLHDRGRLAAGMAADVVVFDPTTVGSLPAERVHDLPAGGDRLLARSIGIVHVMVNGVFVRSDGADVRDACPGVVLAPG